MRSEWPTGWKPTSVWDHIRLMRRCPCAVCQKDADDIYDEYLKQSAKDAADDDSQK